MPTWERGGMYHHGIAQSLTRTSGTSLVGYAGDGFKIYYRPSEKKSGWRLRRGRARLEDHLAFITDYTMKTMNMLEVKMHLTDAMVPIQMKIMHTL